VETPVRLELPLPATRIFAPLSGYYGCGELEDGSLHCWGENTYGQLGTGMRGETCLENAPGDLYCSPLPSRALLDVPAERYAFGELHACAVTVDGALYCWGYGGGGQLGLQAELLSECIAGRLCSPLPQPVPTESPVVDIALGARYTCVLQQDGRVLCWGWGNPLNPVDDSEEKRLDCVFSDTPCEVDPSWEGSAERIFTTQYDRLCVLTSEKELHCLRRFETGSRLILAGPVQVEE
jgi:alpha-tubulin suppressor-like RCC1 family protein